MGITTSARSLARRTSNRYTNVGRVDRLIRVCLALSLLMLGGFSIALASRSTFGGVVFCIAALYCLVTAALGSDPVYWRAGIDTREEESEPETVDLRTTESTGLPVLSGSGDHTS